jgi:hypothetical protein
MTHNCPQCHDRCIREMPFNAGCVGVVHLCAAGHSWVSAVKERPSAA